MKKVLSVLFIALCFALVVACGGNNANEEAANNTTNNATENNASENNTTENNAGNDNTENAANSGEDAGDVDPRLAELREAGVVTVGFANEAPYAYEDENGELQGAAVEIAKAVFGELGIPEVEGSLSQWNQLIPSVQTGKVDAVTAGMAINADRCPQVSFSEPTVKYGEGLVVAEGNPHNLISYEDIAANPDIKVAVMSGATENDFLIEAGVSEDQIVSAPDIAATLNMVQTDRAQVTTATEMTVKDAMEQMDDSGLEYVVDFVQPDVPGVPSYGATAFSPDDTGLRDAYNEKLKELRDNGTIEEILNSLDLWGSENVPEDDVTMEQLCQEA